MDLDDLLGTIFDDADIGSVRSRRAQLVARMVLGLLGGTLCLAGAFIFLTQPDRGGTPSMRVSMAGVFLGLAAFSICNVMFARAWKWPWLTALAVIVALFAVSIAGR